MLDDCGPYFFKPNAMPYGSLTAQESASDYAFETILIGFPSTRLIVVFEQ
jgi:hypothetical protein